MSINDKNGSYNFQVIESKWRSHWQQAKVYKTPGPGDPGYDPDKPKCYILDMFPYPSGSGLHIGHPKGYIASDIYSRYKRMQGYNVLHPMGFDSFGLPAEQYAIEHNIHPATITEQNIDAIRSQLQFLGLSFDWDREIATSREDYYRWTQWIFIQLYQSYFDPDESWQDGNGRVIHGRAKDIKELEAAFAAGRHLSDDDKKNIGADRDWAAMSTAQRAAVLNNYRLAYQEEVVVNWCPGLGTVLANEEVTNEGRSERGDFPVYRKPLKQWIMRITAYAERLLEDLDAELETRAGDPFVLDWPDPIKLMQRNWIGRSEGAEVLFDVLSPDGGQTAATLPVFTTRPDTLFGATFMVLAPQHPLVDSEHESYLVPSTWEDGLPEKWKGEDPNAPIGAALASYIQQAANAAATGDEEKEKTGVFTGIYARNPVNGERIPIFVGDYVSMDYGAGAIMAVPAHDERDFAFATAFELPIVAVVAAEGQQEGPCYAGEGVSINSPAEGNSAFAITGLPTNEAKKKMTAALARASRGQAAVNYKLRDWIFSRQRYWGEPFPLATHAEGYSVPVEPPVILPAMEDFRPETSDDPGQPVSPPLHRAGDAWTEVEIAGETLRRELNVMPQWAGSCWYYLRFIDPHNDEAFCDHDKEGYFMPVDLYIGGAEHAVLHLLYARFWHKALYDLGHISTPEPFKKLFNQGMITADAFQDERGVYIDIREVEFRDGQAYQSGTDKKLKRSAGKMGKRYKNGLPPEEVGEEFGVDTLRLYEMYMGPLEASAPWSMEGIRGMQRFLQRVWRNFVDQNRNIKLGQGIEPDIEKKLHQTIKKVTHHIEGLRFNTAIAALIELNNDLVGLEEIPEGIARPFLKLLAPLAPHIAEEIWSLAALDTDQLSSQAWPKWDEGKMAEDTVVLPIQVNGKMRGQVEVPVSMGEEHIKVEALAVESVKKYVPDEEKIKRFILIPGKIVNIVV